MVCLKSMTYLSRALILRATLENQRERTKDVSKVKVGILGAGFIAKVHIGNLKNDAGVEVAGVVRLVFG